jgi:hypothetical protein
MWRLCLVILIGLKLEAQAVPEPESCERYEIAARADSANAQAWYALGRCAYRDYEMVAPGGDSTRLAFRSSWTVALRALRRAVMLDPTFGRAYRPLLAMLFGETRDGCSSKTGLCLHVAPNLRVADSLITIPRRVPEGPEPYADVVREAAESHHANLIEARDIATRWAAVAPNERMPHEYLGRASLRLDDPLRAAEELERAAQLGTPASRRSIFFDRFEALVKANRGSDARRVIDEAADDPMRDSMHLTFRLASLDMLVGRLRHAPIDSVTAPALRARFDSLARLPRPTPPPSPSQQFTSAIASGDTGAARRALAAFDSSLDLPNGKNSSDFAQELFHSAKLHLMVGDSVGADARLAALERGLFGQPFQYNLLIASLGPWLGDAWLLSGDLAAARGRRAEAARMYRRLIGLWEGGDSTLQSPVRRAYQRLAALPNSPTGGR